MPHWIPQEYGEIVKRTNHRAKCVMCGDELYKGDKAYRMNRHGVRLICGTCKKAVQLAEDILKRFRERVK